MMVDPETYIKKLAAAGDIQKLNQMLSQIYFYQFASLNFGGAMIPQSDGNLKKGNFTPITTPNFGIPT